MMGRGRERERGAVYSAQKGSAFRPGFGESQLFNAIYKWVRSSEQEAHFTVHGASVHFPLALQVGTDLSGFLALFICGDTLCYF